MRPGLLHSPGLRLPDPDWFPLPIRPGTSDGGWSPFVAARRPPFYESIVSFESGACGRQS
jgi:hypothetical protein